MGKPRKEWRKKDAYDQWNDHTDDQSNRFFKVLIGDFRNSLVLPDKLALHFGGKIATSIKLESRSGHTFDVQVAKNSSRLEFQSGWELFVSAHDLKMFDFLVFKYVGISRMKVLIFDPSGCEKVPPCFVTKNDNGCGQWREESIDISSNNANLPMETPEVQKKAGKQRDRSKTIDSSSSSESSG